MVLKLTSNVPTSIFAFFPRVESIIVPAATTPNEKLARLRAAIVIPTFEHSAAIGRTVDQRTTTHSENTELIQRRRSVRLTVVGRSAGGLTERKILVETRRTYETRTRAYFVKEYDEK